MNTAERYTHRKNLKPINVGESVRMQPIDSKGSNMTWKEATVCKTLARRNYEVSTDKGKTFRRNRRLLRRSCNREMCKNLLHQ